MNMYTSTALFLYSNLTMGHFLAIKHVSCVYYRIFEPRCIQRFHVFDQNKLTCRILLTGLRFLINFSLLI